MTLLSIDPSTSSLGFAVYRDGKVLDDGAVSFEYASPSDYLAQLNGWLNAMIRTHPRRDGSDIRE